MATNKKETKKTIAKTEVAENKGTQKCPFGEIELADGTKVVKSGAFIERPDGKYEVADARHIVNAAECVVEVDVPSPSGKPTMKLHCRYKKHDSGNFTFTVGTSDSIHHATGNVVHKDKKDENGNPLVRFADLDFIGRGDPALAMVCLELLSHAVFDSIGVSGAYCLVRVELNHDTKTWTALCVPKVDVM